MAELKTEEERDYEAEIEKIIDSNISDDEKRKQLVVYHDSVFAFGVEKLTKDERIKLYKILGNEKTADIAKKAINSNESVRSLILKENIMDEEELSRILDPIHMTEPGISGKDVLMNI